MIDNPICREVADAYLTMTPDDFSAWLAAKAATQPGSDYELIQGGVGNLTKQWVNDYATPKPRSATRGG